jgi:hypothetical protein
MDSKHPKVPPINVGFNACGFGGSATRLEANSASRIIPTVLDQICE